PTLTGHRPPKVNPIDECVRQASLDGHDGGIVSLSHAMRAHLCFMLIVQDVKLVERRCSDEEPNSYPGCPQLSSLRYSGGAENQHRLGPSSELLPIPYLRMGEESSPGKWPVGPAHHRRRLQATAGEGVAKSRFQFQSGCLGDVQQEYQGPEDAGGTRIWLRAGLVLGPVGRRWTCHVQHLCDQGGYAGSRAGRREK